MIKRLVLAAAAALMLGAFVAAPAQAASIATPAGAAQLNVHAASDVVEVRHRRRWRRHGRRYHRWHRPYYYSYYAPRRCGYVVRPHRGRVVYRCW